MGRARSPRQVYGDKIRDEIFGNEYKGTRSPAWIAEKIGVSKATAYSWKKDPGKIPAYQYLRIKSIIGE
ncbi:MAG: hypothetical protein IJP92_08525 [Lachnospiraceae bacterium]|nr:hypothetical protein [Oscillospiraceae bacterium]MBR0091730.1 hypothetical protein [Lachnospiraceae bacterium]